MRGALLSASALVRSSCEWAQRTTAPDLRGHHVGRLALSIRRSLRVAAARGWPRRGDERGYEPRQ